MKKTTLAGADVSSPTVSECYGSLFASSITPSPRGSFWKHRAGPVARGLARGEAVVRTAALDDTRRHARDLAATVGQMVEAEGLKAREMEGVMVGRGPGSYTGLRVGIMSAKALAYAVGCRLVAVDTFAAIALQVPADVERVWVIADALQGQIYRQPFVRTGAASADPPTSGRIVRFDEVEARPGLGDWITVRRVGGLRRTHPQFPRVPEATARCGSRACTLLDDIWSHYRCRRC